MPRPPSRPGGRSWPRCWTSTERIYRDFRFRSGVTTISTPVSQVIQKREGVCQDFTHVMVSALRGLGLPARYTSGYIRTRPPPGQTKRQGADQSHAWVGAWIGPAFGWVDVDPTNGIVVKDEHVLLGWGRDFNDVSPLRGVILGGGRHNVSVSVDLEPTSRWSRRMSGLRILSTLAVMGAMPRIAEACQAATGMTLETEFCADRRAAGTAARRGRGGYRHPDRRRHR